MVEFNDNVDYLEKSPGDAVDKHAYSAQGDLDEWDRLVNEDVWDDFEHTSPG